VGLQRHHRYFLWDMHGESAPYGLAYNLSLHALCLRASSLPAARASLRCAAALPAPPGLLTPPTPVAPPAAGRSLLESSGAEGGTAEGGATARRGGRGLLRGAARGTRGAARGTRGAARGARGGRGGARLRGGVGGGVGGGGVGGGGVGGGGGGGGGVRCSAECAAHEVLYPQIESDLAALHHRITKPKVDSALARWADTS